MQSCFLCTASVLIIEGIVACTCQGSRCVLWLLFLHHADDDGNQADEQQNRTDHDL